MEATVGFIPEMSPWNSTVSSILTSLSPIFPGFVAGLVAAQKGFTVGAIASVLTSILWSAYVNFINPRSATEHVNATIPDEVTFALTALIVGGICGIAGATVGREKWNAF
jgi:hypothetical protein